MIYTRTSTWDNKISSQYIFVLTDKWSIISSTSLSKSSNHSNSLFLAQFIYVMSCKEWWVMWVYNSTAHGSLQGKVPELLYITLFPSAASLFLPLSSHFLSSSSPMMTEPPSSHISFLISFFLSLVQIFLLGRIMSPLILLVAKTPWDFEVD